MPLGDSLIILFILCMETASMIPQLSPPELISLTLILNSSIPTNVLARIHQDLDYDPFSPTLARVQRKNSRREQVATHNYALYPELCLSCLRHTNLTVSAYVVLDCHRCYQVKTYDRGTGYYRLQNISSILGLAAYGMEYAYTSQIIYHLLKVQPHVTCNHR